MALKVPTGLPPTEKTPEVPLKVYEFLSPNHDGKNETLYIDGLSSYPANELIVLDKWGQVVFSQKNYDNSWAGGSLPDDNYFYILKPKEATELKGGLILCR